MNRKLLVLLVSIVVAAVAAVILFRLYGPQGDTLALVAGEKVSKAEYIVMMQTQRDKFLAENNVLDENAKKKFWDTKIDGKPPEEIVRERTLDKIKELKIQLAKARENGITAGKSDSDEAKSYVDDLKVSLSGSSDKKVLEQEFMNKYGVTSAQYAQLYEEAQIARKLVDQEFNSINIPESEIKSCYDKNKDTLDKLTVRDIVFYTTDPQTDEPLSEDKVQLASKNALEMLDRINAGEDMEALALKYSEDSQVQQTKGEYTFTYSDQQNSEVDDWAVKAKAGDTGIVNTPYGYYVLKLEQRSSYDEVRDAAKELVFEGKYTELLNNWKKDPEFKLTITNPKLYDSIILH